MDFDQNVKVYSVNKTHSIKCKFYDIKVNQYSNNIWCFLPVFLWDFVFQAMHSSLELVYGKYICKGSYNTVQNVLCNYPTTGSCALSQ